MQLRHRSVPGVTSFLVLIGAVWLAVGIRMLFGSELLAVSMSHAVMQLLPALLYAAVVDHLVLKENTLRTVTLVLGFALAVVAATTSLHGLYLVATPTGGVELGLLGKLSFLFVCGVVGLAVFTLLDRFQSASHSAHGIVVFAALPIAITLIGLSGLVLSPQQIASEVFAASLGLAAALATIILFHQEYTNRRGVVRDLLFARLQEPVVALDAKNQIVDCNQAFADLIDYPLLELRGLPIHEIVGAENLTGLLSAHGAEYMVPWRLADDMGTAQYLVQSTPLAVDSAEQGRLLIMTEHSSRVHTEQALESADMMLEQANASLDRMTLRDEVTGLANQRHFGDELEREVARHQRSERRFGVIAIEADHFQLLAEQHGAEFRDRALALIARAIEVEVRDTDLCARLEGEEFAVLAVQMKDSGLVHLAERIRKRVLKVRPLTSGGQRIRMSVSCGVGVYDPKSDDLKRLLARTNKYLAEAKRTGRNKVVSGD